MAQVALQAKTEVVAPLVVLEHQEQVEVLEHQEQVEVQELLVLVVLVELMALAVLADRVEPQAQLAHLALAVLAAKMAQVVLQVKTFLMNLQG